MLRPTATLVCNSILDPSAVSTSYLLLYLRVLTLVSTSYSLLIFDSKILNRKGIYLSLTVQIMATFTRCENE